MSERARPLVTHADVLEGWQEDEETGGLVRMVREEDSVKVGLWKPNGTAGRKIEFVLEANETIVVPGRNRRGQRKRRRAGLLRPGVVMSVPRGCRLSWVVADDFRELWIYS